VRILQDTFPALVSVAGSPPPAGETIPPGSRKYRAKVVDRARVIVTADRVIIAVDGTSDEGPLIVFSQPYSAGNFVKAGNADNASTVITDNGAYVSFSRGQDCACGSRLRGWNPFRAISSSRDPQV